MLLLFISALGGLVELTAVLPRGSQAPPPPSQGSGGGGGSGERLSGGGGEAAVQARLENAGLQIRNQILLTAAKPLPASPKQAAGEAKGKVPPSSSAAATATAAAAGSVPPQQSRQRASSGGDSVRAALLALKGCDWRIRVVGGDRAKVSA